MVFHIFFHSCEKVNEKVESMTSRFVKLLPDLLKTKRNRRTGMKSVVIPVIKHILVSCQQ